MASKLTERNKNIPSQQNALHKLLQTPSSSVKVQYVDLLDSQ